MSEEDRVPVVPLRLEQLNSIILLGCAVRAVFIIASVTRVDLAPEHGAFESAAGFAHFIRR